MYSMGDPRRSGPGGSSTSNLAKWSGGALAVIGFGVVAERRGYNRGYRDGERDGIKKAVLIEEREEKLQKDELSLHAVQLAQRENQRICEVLVANLVEEGADSEVIKRTCKILLDERADELAALDNTSPVKTIAALTGTVKVLNASFADLGLLLMHPAGRSFLYSDIIGGEEVKHPRVLGTVREKEARIAIKEMQEILEDTENPDRWEAVVAENKRLAERFAALAEEQE